VIVRDSVITNNKATAGGSFAGNGAGIQVWSGTLTLISSTVSGNVAANGGGGIYFRDTADARASQIVASTISGNSVTGSDGHGGGIGVDDDHAQGPVMIENSTISGNSAPSIGGGIDDFAPSPVLTIESSTIAGNSAGARGGGIYTGHGVALRNTVVAANTGPDGADLFTHSPGASDAAFSLIQAPVTGSLTSSGPNVLGSDPLLGPLADNGGPTQTRAPAAGSPAIDRGRTTLTSDQRGRPRPIDWLAVPDVKGGNGADIGAVELPAPTLRCQGKVATLAAVPHSITRGTPGADVIVGTRGRDRIRSGKGRDTVCGGAGGDDLLGGPGKDALIGGPGADKLAGGSGRDVLKGGPGRDALLGGPGRDKLVGGPGLDKQRQ
jgi:Ca2+-binding RTX toxin-like protein